MLKEINNIMKYTLDNQLKRDSFLIAELKLCQVLLMNNSIYPWIILVPKKANITEIIDLKVTDQKLLIEEIALISKILKEKYQPKKLNIAALGNMVAQLHIHIIVRFEDDPTFPKPVWVSDKRKFYKKEESEKLIKELKVKIIPSLK